jgi:hypothetical protein
MDYYSFLRKPILSTDAQYVERKVMGIFDPLNLCISFDKEVQDKINSLKSGGFFYRNEISETTLMSYSTFIHENIHW